MHTSIVERNSSNLQMSLKCFSFVIGSIDCKITSIDSVYETSISRRPSEFISKKNGSTPYSISDRNI